MDSALLPGFVTGGFAILGVLVGAILQRRLQHRAWLFEKRTDAFVKFLELLDRALGQIHTRIDQYQEGGLEPPPTDPSLMEEYNTVSFRAQLFATSTARNRIGDLNAVIRRGLARDVSRLNWSDFVWCSAYARTLAISDLHVASLAERILWLQVFRKSKKLLRNLIKDEISHQRAKG